MNTWNDKTNIAYDNARVIKFFFETDKGPGNVTAMVNKGVSITNAKAQLMESFKGVYETIELTKYEIIEILPNTK